MQRYIQQQNQQAYLIHQRRLSDIKSRKSSLPKLDKTFDSYKQNRYIAARKQEINRWEGIMKQNKKLLHKLNNVEQSIRSVSSCNSKRSIELKENRKKENARMHIKLQQITSTYDKSNSKTSPRAVKTLPKYLNNQEKSLNVKPIKNFKFQNQGYQRHKSLQQPQKEETKIRNIIQQYQQVLDKILPLIKQEKLNK
ncbi:unnamed protein product [Paramecium primaurelia]|uniref:Uncharacterized protein n=1 Tax=Paramecium primaurelia TaxID=5886 RepID=A0A8S1NQ71_PARPR|nr:unnamed protein product [Paramecium primaurelia]